ncbi:MAG: hypothetical protein ACOCQC_03985, partial [Halanaerobiaceae bacterium]
NVSEVGWIKVKISFLSSFMGLYNSSISVIITNNPTVFAGGGWILWLKSKIVPSVASFFPMME